MRKINHNDFHAGNIIIQQLEGAQARRRNGSEIRCCDRLGSLSEDRRSGNGYKGDLHWIGGHIDQLSDLLIPDNGLLSDLDARLSLELRMLAKTLVPAVENQRTPTSVELIRRIEDAYYRTAEPWRPWRQPFQLDHLVILQRANIRGMECSAIAR